MENFTTILRACSVFAKKNGLNIEYRNANFSIKMCTSLKGGDDLKTYTETNSLHSSSFLSTPSQHEIVIISSSNIGYFVRTVDTASIIPFESGELIRKGQILGFCVFGEFCIPVRSTCSGRLDCYLIEDGEMMDFGRDLARLIVGVEHEN